MKINYGEKCEFIRMFKLMGIDSPDLDMILNKFYDDVFEKGYKCGYDDGLKDGEQSYKEYEWEKNNRLTW